MKTMSTNRQAGAVSLFVVIFAMLIITVITVSFLRLMINDQMQASNADLSQSAHDSASAAVEDAKRALLRYQEICRNDTTACGELATQLATDVCNAGLLDVIGAGSVSGGTPSNPGEVKVQQSVDESDQSLDQAYTCVTMKLKTDDYIGTLTANQTQLVPLIGEDGRTFDTVNIKWFSSKDVGNTTGEVDLLDNVNPQPLTSKDANAWPANRPSVLRTQLIQFGDNFTLGDFDIVNGSSEANAMTLFLYPSSAGSAMNDSTFTGRDIRKDNANGSPLADATNNSPLPVRCEESVSDGGYACTMALQLPAPINGRTPGKNPTAFLRLTPFYNATHFQVVLSQGALNSSSLVKFQDVQPEIDATGRANDLFRRLQVRVDLFDTSFQYPDATIDVTGNFCKDFSVTDSTYIPGDCTP